MPAKRAKGGARKRSKPAAKRTRKSGPSKREVATFAAILKGNNKSN